MPTTNVAFWQENFSKIIRDNKDVELLLAQGRRVLVVWECPVGLALPEYVIDNVTVFIMHELQTVSQVVESEVF